MRIVGLLMFLSGFAGAGFSIAQAYSQARPKDLLYATLAPLAAVAAVLGLVLLFAPGFFG